VRLQPVTAELEVYVLLENAFLDQRELRIVWPALPRLDLQILGREIADIRLVDLDVLDLRRAADTANQVHVLIGVLNRGERTSQQRRRDPDFPQWRRHLGIRRDRVLRDASDAEG